MIEVVDIRQVEDGFMLRWNNPDRLAEGAYVHITEAWAEDFHRHQFKPYGIQHGAMNRLRYGLVNGTLDTDNAGSLFAEAYEAAVLNGAARRVARRRESSPFDEFIAGKGKP